MKLTRSQQEFIADKLMDGANLALGGLVFGQLAARNIEISVFVLGLMFYLWSWAMSLLLRKGVH